MPDSVPLSDSDDAVAGSPAVCKQLGLGVAPFDERRPLYCRAIAALARPLANLPGHGAEVAGVEETEHR